MLTRLKVSGFKNLVDVDVRFGSFTCIAGANGIGKSNLFDAICFLSALADRPLLEAAKSVRDEGGRTVDVRSLFHRVADTHDQRMQFEAEMIVPYEGFDDLGQRARAGITFLRYSLVLASRQENGGASPGGLELLSEDLVHINRKEAAEHLRFKHSPKWRNSALQGRRTSPFISTEGDGDDRVIKLHQDGGGGRPLSRPAASLPRSVLSVANAAESPTALLARREMQSWRLLQLEPSALRRPDEFTAPTRLGTDGSHLAATLYHLARSNGTSRTSEGQDSSTMLYAKVANALSELIQEVREVYIDRDEKRELLTLRIKDQDGTAHPARALSDGTLRFLALTVLELDPDAKGLLCLEEPENGIHPERVPAMLELLQNIATDVHEPVGTANPLRQVIINTHSPAVVAQVSDEDLLLAELIETVRNGRRFKRACFSCLPETWRTLRPAQGEASRVVARGKLLAYLNPVARREPGETTRTRRVIDRPDLNQLVISFPEDAG